MGSRAGTDTCHDGHKFSMRVMMALEMICERTPRCSVWQANNVLRLPLSGVLQRPKEGHQILFLLTIQLQLQDEIEELYRIIQRQQTTVVQIWR